MEEPATLREGVAESSRMLKALAAPARWLRMWARWHVRRKLLKQQKVVENLRFARHCIEHPPDPGSEDSGRLFVVVQILRRMGLYLRPSMEEAPDRVKLDYLAWLIALIEERDLDTAFRYVWPHRHQTRAMRRRTQRLGRRSLWQRMVEALGDYEEQRAAMRKE